MVSSGSSLFPNQEKKPVKQEINFNAPTRHIRAFKVSSLFWKYKSLSIRYGFDSYGVQLGALLERWGFIKIIDDGSNFLLRLGALPKKSVLVKFLRKKGFRTKVENYNAPVDQENLPNFDEE